MAPGYNSGNKTAPIGTVSDVLLIGEVDRDGLTGLRGGERKGVRMGNERQGRRRIPRRGGCREANP